MAGVTPGFVDRLRRRCGNASDYRIAQMLGVRPSAISHWRAGRSEVAPEIGIRLAKLLEIDPAIILCRVEAARAKCPAVAAVWMRLALEAELAQVPETVQVPARRPRHRRSPVTA